MHRAPENSANSCSSAPVSTSVPQVSSVCELSSDEDIPLSKLRTEHHEGEVFGQRAPANPANKCSSAQVSNSVSQVSSVCELSSDEDIPLSKLRTEHHEGEVFGQRAPANSANKCSSAQVSNSVPQVGSVCELSSDEDIPLSKLRTEHREGEMLGQRAPATPAHKCSSAQVSNSPPPGNIDCKSSSDKYIPMSNSAMIIACDIHQGDLSVFSSETVGRQCVPNCLAFFAFAYLRSSTDWQCVDLNAILKEGNRLYSEIPKTHPFLSISDIPEELNIFEVYWLTQKSFEHSVPLDKKAMLDVFGSKLPRNHKDILIMIGNDTGMGSAVGVRKNRHNVLLFDPHSRSTETGLLASNGVCVIITFRNYDQLCDHLMLLGSSLHCNLVSITRMCLTKSSAGAQTNIAHQRS